ncbi:hypothetical protein JOL79_19755 [Microbispora sp. RL4-1S]|uniref:Uncharacterized protein n=1 Tax=Microbispora oryzae TaxID=2806554 RepID=A0A941AL91_9ACTN|nr:hypothetical protein [Microbispora oryzae]MBP2706048.1 hypothetical protein [Microbispora oryzae]
MSEGPERGQPPEIVHQPADDVHEYTVDQVRDVTRQKKIVLYSDTKGVDTAFRQLFPTTYDLTLDHPEGTETGEDK